MDSARKLVRASAIILFGGVLYVGLNWVPLAGPLVVGFIVGWLWRGAPKECFKAGVYSGVIGFILLSLLFSWWRLNAPANELLSSVLAAWIILLWNILGVLFTGLGAAVFGVVNSFGRFFGFDFMPKTPGGTAAVSYRICSKCGNGFLKNDGGCRVCGEKIGVA